jgi:hypothetical protein
MGIIQFAFGTVDREETSLKQVSDNHILFPDLSFQDSDWSNVRCRLWSILGRDIDGQAVPPGQVE